MSTVSDHMRQHFPSCDPQQLLQQPRTSHFSTERATVLKPPTLLIGFAACAIAGFAAPAFPQDCHSDAQKSLPIDVEGSSTPDRIPDDVAYAHFVLEGAIPSRATPAEIARQKTLLAHVGLNAQDTSAAVTALKGVKEELDAIAAQAAAPSKTPLPDKNRLLELNAQRLRVLSGARSALLAALSVRGRAAVESYVRTSIKPQITIFANR